MTVIANRYQLQNEISAGAMGAVFIGHDSAPEPTARQRLNLPDETLFHLSGMEFPKWETPEYAATEDMARKCLAKLITSRI
jgi:hypothetical protein